MESGKSKVKDRVLEHGVMSDVNFPKRYRKSLKQINLLNEEYEKNWNLLEYQ